MMPALCRHHASVYRTRAAAIRNLPHGHKALAREARLISKQCRECISIGAKGQACQEIWGRHVGQ